MLDEAALADAAPPQSLPVMNRLLSHSCAHWVPLQAGVQLTLGRRRSNYCLGHCLSWQSEDSGGRIVQWLLSPCLEVALATSTHVPCTREVTLPEPPLVNGSSILQGPCRKGPDEGGKAGILTITQSIPVNNIAFYS